MSRKTAIIVGVACMTLLLLILTPICYVRWTRYDATIYAHEFSEAKFRQVHKGMTKTEVEYVLGKPLTNDTEGHVQGIMDEENRWHYAFLDRAKIPDDDRVCNTWFQIREVTFDEHGKVKEIVSTAEQFE